jgi:hypothetical protein
MKLQNVGWLVLCLVFLSACNNGTDTPTTELTLTADPTQVTSGGTTTLTATIIEGADNVDLVEFAVKDGAVISSDDGTDGSYTAVSAALSADTIFVATAKDSDRTVLGVSNEAFVTVTAALPQANAEDKAVTTLIEVPVVAGETPASLAVTTEQLVVENGNAEKVEGSEVGGVAAVEADGGFTFTPTPGFSGAASFRYKVVNDANSDEATVTVTVTPLPGNTRIVRSLADLTTATGDAAVETILIGDTIRCNVDNCITLGEGQTLTGGATVEGIEVSNPAARIQARVDGDEPTDPTQNNITVIELAPNTTLEAIEISGRDIYTAINGRAVDLSGTLTIRNVEIGGPTSNAPFAIRFDGDGGDAFGSYYTLNVDSLNITNATNPIGINAFSSLEFKNSTIGMNIEYAPSSREFGISFHAYGDATALVDNLEVSSSTGNTNFSPVKFAQSSGGGVYTFTLSNTDVNFAGGVDLATANAFFVNHGNPQTPGGKIVMNTADSKGNTTNSTAPDKAKFIATGQANSASWIEGQLEINGQNVP